MTLRNIISRIRILADMLSAKNNKNNVSTPKKHVVLITSQGLDEFNNLSNERKDPVSQKIMGKIKQSVNALIQSERHEGQSNGIEVRRDSSGNSTARGMLEIRTPPSVQIRGFIKSFTSGDTTYWTVLGFIRKKKDSVDQGVIDIMNKRFNGIDQSDPLSSKCVYWI